MSPARAAAWRALLRLRAGGRLDDTRAGLPELDALSARDRALANELVTGTVKRRASLDAVLAVYTRSRLDRTDAEVLESLRLAAYQLLFLTRVPDYAVVDDAVALVAAHGRRTAGFVNAVARRVAADGRATLDRLGAGDGTRAWQVRHSAPGWLVRLLRAELGDEAAAAFLAAANAAPERCLRVNMLKTDLPSARAALTAAGFATEGIAGLPAALLYSGPPLERAAAFAEGLVTPQSRGSQVAVHVAAGRCPPGAAILDLCAAPGTKTAQLAALVPGAALTAVDLDAPRVAAMTANLRRLGVGGVRAVTGDAVALPAEHDSAYDAVLLDAPCSGLGTLASRPDLRWRRRASDVRRLAELQVRLLERAGRCVRPGGTLTYAVCTLPQAETVAAVGALLEAGGWEVDDLGAAWPALAHPGAGGYLLTLPPAAGSSGFFIARLRRAA